MGARIGTAGTAAYCAPEVLSPESPSAEEGYDELELLLKADVSGKSCDCSGLKYKPASR